MHFEVILKERHRRGFHSLNHAVFITQFYVPDSGHGIMTEDIVAPVSIVSAKATNE